MDITLFVAAVYLQPIFFIWAFNRRMPVEPRLFQVLGLGLAGALAWTRFGSGYYTNEILIFYSLSVVFCIHHYRDRPGFQSVSLAFLVVFLNSFFWEVPIHLSNLWSAPGLVLFQSAHLYVVPFLLLVGFTFPKRWWYWCIALWTFTSVLAIIRPIISLHFYSVSSPINMVCRVVSLYTLLWVLQFPGYGDKLIFRVKDRLRGAVG